MQCEWPFWKRQNMRFSTRIDMETKDILLDPVAFFEYVSGFEAYDYQMKFLRSQAKKIAVRAGRQTGKSTMIAGKTLYYAFMNPNQHVLIIAAYKRQAELVFWKIKEYAHNAEFVRSKIIRETQTQLHFDNGSVIFCLPAGKSGHSIRGFSPHMVVMDEAAFTPDEVFEAVEPSIQVTKGFLILASNTFGKSGFFYEAFNYGSGYETYHIRASDCPSYSKEKLEQLKKTKSKTIFAQEYEAEFIEEADNFFPTGLVKKCESDIEEIYGPEQGKSYILSVDVARFGTDESVFMVAEVSKNLLKVVKVISTIKKPITDLVGRIKDLHQTFNFDTIYIDATTLGAGGADFLIEGNLPVTPVNLNGKNKSELYKKLKTKMEQGKITYPYIPKLREQMYNLKYTFSSMGYITLSPPKKGHDDYPDALALLMNHGEHTNTQVEFVMASG